MLQVKVLGMAILI